MLKNLFKFEFNNYWRNIDKNILFGFTLFFLGLFFIFVETSSIAGERLDKTYYFFFKTFNFYIFRYFYNVYYFCNGNFVVKKIIIPLFMLSLLLLVLVPIIGGEVKGAKRWLNFYLFRFQPRNP